MIRKKITSAHKRKSQILRRRDKNGGAQFELLIRKTGQHMYATIINLKNGNTMTTVSTIHFLKDKEKTSRREASALVGKEIASYCSKDNIQPAINIANHRFHGLVKELVDMFSNNLKK